MKTATAHKILQAHGWDTIPDFGTAANFLANIEASGTRSLNGERMTADEITALRAIAAGSDYRIESAKGTHHLRSETRAAALAEARAWQAEYQASFADFIGPRGGTVRL